MYLSIIASASEAQRTIEHSTFSHQFNVILTVRNAEDTYHEKEKRKNSSSRVFVINLRTSVVFCVEGGKEATGISQDKNILVANANLPLRDNKHNILPDVPTISLETTPKVERCHTLETGVSCCKQNDALSTQLKGAMLERQSNGPCFVSKPSSPYSLHPTRQCFPLSLKGKKNKQTLTTNYLLAYLQLCSNSYQTINYAT